MTRRLLISGPNFSGRSGALMTLLRDGTFAPESFYVGPYSEGALSGLSSTIADEIDLYRAGPTRIGRKSFSPIDFASLRSREPQTLSGGEQVLLALHCFSLSDYRAIAIDTALEQLDPANRGAALAFLEPRNDTADDVAVIDNRLPPQMVGWSTSERTSDTAQFDCDPVRAITDLTRAQAPTVALHGVHFAYTESKPIFRSVDLALEGGRAYRLAGPNGAGKTTFLKLLVGVLAPSAGEFTLGGARYRPWRHGNRAFALAAQNPDHQWCGATLREDLARRRAAFASWTLPERLAAARIETLAAALGVHSLDAHLYELPLAARKRLSWLWPLAGALPWAVLDEPSIGQDVDTRLRLASAIGQLTTLGHGVVFVTHDDEFAARIPHRVLTIGNMQIGMA